jgi:hypothetical protein
MLDGKRVELLRELVPQSAMLAFLVNPNNPTAESQVTVKETPGALGQDYYVLSAGTEHDLDMMSLAQPQGQHAARAERSIFPSGLVPTGGVAQR